MAKSVSSSRIDESAKIYKDVTIKNSTIKSNCSIGDLSKIEDAFLDEYVRIDRQNYIWKSYIGRHSYTGSNTKIINTSIGNFVSISWNVTIGAANHDYTRISTHSFLYNNFDKLRPDNIEPVYDRFSDECTIGNDVWIGTGAIILRDVIVGNGAVIAAGAVVTKNVPAYAIVTGCPAKVIKYRFHEEKIKTLEKIKWWNWDDNTIKSNFNFFINEEL